MSRAGRPQPPAQHPCLTARDSPSQWRVYVWWMPPIQGMSDLERRTVRAALVAELERTQEQALSLSAQFDDIVVAAEMSNVDDEHDPEGTTIAFERSQVSALHSRAVRDAAALQQNLADLDDEDFGACEQCGRPIGFERLVALPATRCCVQCAR
jgi:DnaK suppressor protein